MNNNNFLLIFLIAILTLIFTSTCRKDINKISCNSINTISYSQDAYDRFFFKDSTYWVYQEISSLKFDSVWVFDSKISVLNEHPSGRDFETKCFQVNSYRLNNVLDERVNVVFQPKFKDRIIPYEQEYLPINYTIKIGSMFFPVFRIGYDGASLRKENQEGGIWDTEDSLTIKGIKYSNLLKLTNPENNIDIYKEAWYVKNIGLVKFIKKDGKTWELIRYHINQ